jgi:hypothetical protein
MQEGIVPQADYSWFIDGSSFIYNGQQRTGYAIVSDSTLRHAPPFRYDFPKGQTNCPGQSSNPGKKQNY